MCQMYQALSKWATDIWRTSFNALMEDVGANLQLEEGITEF